MKVTDLIPSTGTDAVDPAIIVNLIKSRQRVGAASVSTSNTTSLDKPGERLELFKRQWDPLLHDIMDKNKIPDNMIVAEDGGIERIEEVTRTPLGLQKVIVGKSATFLFGVPVTLQCQPADAGEQQVLDATDRIWKDNKLDALNREIARHLFRTTQVAECWTPIEKEPHDTYGFPTPFKLRVQVFSPANGDSLYPFYDEFGDMIAFGRGVTRSTIVDGRVRDVEYLEVYTATETAVYWNINGQWSEQERRPNQLGKIPIAYAEQEAVEWHDVQTLITRLELSMSRLGDTNDYHSSPILFIRGAITRLFKKGSSKKVFKSEDEKGDAKYVGWDHATASVKLEQDTLLRLIYSLTQTPDLSFDSVKGLGLSGTALDKLLTDPKLKATDKQEILLPYLIRRLRIIAGYVGLMNTALATPAKKITITPIINEFRVDDAGERIADLVTAAGGKPIISQRTAVEKLGLVDDIDQEMTRLGEEQKQANNHDVTETGF